MKIALVWLGWITLLVIVTSLTPFIISVTVGGTTGFFMGRWTDKELDKRFVVEEEEKEEDDDWYD